MLHLWVTEFDCVSLEFHIHIWRFDWFYWLIHIGFVFYRVLLFFGAFIHIWRFDRFLEGFTEFFLFLGIWSWFQALIRVAFVGYRVKVAGNHGWRRFYLKVGAAGVAKQGKGRLLFGLARLVGGRPTSTGQKVRLGHDAHGRHHRLALGTDICHRTDPVISARYASTYRRRSRSYH